MHYDVKNPNLEYSMNKDGTDPHILKAFKAVEKEIKESL